MERNKKTGVCFELASFVQYGVDIKMARKMSGASIEAVKSAKFKKKKKF